MTGAPRGLYASRDFIVINLGMVDLVGWEAAAVFQRIAYRAERTGTWQATHAEIQAETRLTEHKVKAALNVLREMGWLEAERADRFDPTRVWRPIWDDVHVTEPHTVTVTEAGTTTVTEPHTVTPYTETVKTTPEPPLPPEGGGVDAMLIDFPAPQPVDADDGFDRWWEMYPRKVGKAAARKAYGRAVKQVGAPKLLEGLFLQLGALAMADRPEGDFRPHPATWLNGGRWDDSPDDVARPCTPPGQKPNYLADSLRGMIANGAEVSPGLASLLGMQASFPAISNGGGFGGSR